jgi:hypothetical protein
MVSHKHTNFNKHTSLLGNLGPYSQHSIFFNFQICPIDKSITMTLGNKGFPVMKRSSLFGALISYEKNALFL